MVNVTDEGKMLLTKVSAQMDELRGLRAFIAKQMEEAMYVESRKHNDALAQTVAALLDEGVPKSRIAEACGYKNYYVSLKDVDLAAQKYRWVERLEKATIASVQTPAATRGLSWAILSQGEWSEPNQWGEREIVLEMEVQDHSVSVWVTDIEGRLDITYVDIAENPDVSVADVNSLKNEIVGALK